FRVHQRKHAALDRGRIGYVDRAPDQWAHLIPSPEIGWIRRSWRLMRGRAFPERHQVRLFPGFAQLLIRIHFGDRHRVLLENRAIVRLPLWARKGPSGAHRTWKMRR